MTTLSVFVQEQGDLGIREVLVEETITSRGLHGALLSAGVILTAESLIFLEEIELPFDRESDEPVHGLHDGHRVHVVRCRQIRVTVNYLHHQAHREFEPNRRVRAVKDWAVKHFDIPSKDAPEHVLRIAGSNEQPGTDAPLHTLVKAHCHLTFDLVPEKRVEG